MTEDDGGRGTPMVVVQGLCEKFKYKTVELILTIFPTEKNIGSYLTLTTDPWAKNACIL